MSSIVDQYRIISAGAGWRDRSARGRLRVDGPDAASFLHALVTNDVVGLTSRRGVYAAYLTPQGRMIADLHIYHRGSWFLVVVPDGLGASLATRLDFLIFSEKVQVADASSRIAQISIVGAGASIAVAGAAGLDTAALDALPAGGQLDFAREGLGAWTSLGDDADAAPFVVRTDDARLPSFDVFVAAADRARFLVHLESAGVVATSPELDAAIRIDAGRPLFGVDMTSETIPLEAGLLERAISTSKGCYVGQEVIIRVLHRGGGRVAKRLVALSIENTHAMPPPGASLMVEGRDAGKLTSVAHALDADHVIALGYLAREFAESGRRFDVAGGAAAVVTDVVGGSLH